MPSAGQHSLVDVSTGDLASALDRLDGTVDPYPVYAALHTGGGVCEIRPGEFVLGGYADCVEVLTRPDRFLSSGSTDVLHEDDEGAAGLLNRLMNAQNPPVHTRMRQSVMRMFTRHQVLRLRPALEGLCDEIVDGIAAQLRDGEVVDVHQDLSTAFPLRALLRYLGVPGSDQSALVDLVPPIFAAGGPAPTADQIEAANVATAELTGFVHALAGYKAGHPAEDVLTQIVAASRDGTLARAEMTSIIAGLIIAGYETTAAGIDLGVLALASHGDGAGGPERPGDMAGFVNEVLRHDSPVQLPPRPRLAAHPTTIGGVGVAAGTRVWPNLGAANRDPTKYTCPAAFDPLRAQAPPLSFGAGIHRCLGIHLARLEMAIALHRVRTRLPPWHLAAPAPVRRRARQLRAFDSILIAAAPSGTRTEGRGQ